MDRLKKIESGDFQTPIELTGKICKFLYETGLKPKTIVEPTCGTGNFVQSCLTNFSSFDKIYGFDIENKYIEALQRKYRLNKKLVFKHQDFFKYNWERFIQTVSEPVLFLGNPPWVTNSKIGSFNGNNLPTKTNFLKLDGFAALTGKSNFDISEWMLLKIISALKNKSGYIAMLCKTSVARKVLTFCWKHNIKLGDSKIVLIDTFEEFDVSVDACLLYISLNKHSQQNPSAEIIDDIEERNSIKTIGYRDGMLISNLELFSKYNYLLNSIISDNRWRTGIKHDCSKVMELKRIKKNTYINGFHEVVELEDKYIYPLMKSSDVSSGREPHRWVIVTQKSVKDATETIGFNAPRTWKYLTKYKELFDKRTSRIYMRRPRFAIFGVGAYTFSPWKIAISGFYKLTVFRLIGNYKNKPVVFDDTVNLLAYQSYKKAKRDLDKLNSKFTQNLIKSLVFWDAKRPITTGLLNHLVISEDHLNTSY